MAKLGDLAAIKLLFQYVLGKPSATVDPDAVDVQEVELYRRAPEHRAISEVLAARMPADVARDVLRLALPYVGATRANQIADGLRDPQAYQDLLDPLAGVDDFEDDFEDDEDDEDDVDFDHGEEGAADESRRPAPAAERQAAGRTRPAPSPNSDFRAPIF
jgi:hypothetical protein